LIDPTDRSHPIYVSPTCICVYTYTHVFLCTICPRPSSESRVDILLIQRLYIFVCIYILPIYMCTICPRPSSYSKDRHSLDPEPIYTCVYIYIANIRVLVCTICPRSSSQGKGDILLIQNLYIFVCVYIYFQYACAYVYNLSEAEYYSYIYMYIHIYTLL